MSWNERDEPYRHTQLSFSSDVQRLHEKARILNEIKRSSENLRFRFSDDLGFGFQVQHQGTGGWNRFKNKTLGVS